MSKTIPSETILSYLLDLGLSWDSSESKFRLMVFGSIDDLSRLFLAFFEFSFYIL
jgi:hypothetical protein